MALGISPLKGPWEALFLMSEVPLYCRTSSRVRPWWEFKEAQGLQRTQAGTDRPGAGQGEEATTEAAAGPGGRWQNGGGDPPFPGDPGSGWAPGRWPARGPTQ